MGTTLLIQLLTKLGLDTGFSGDNDRVYQTCNAGMEYSMTAKEAPYIIKNPDFCETLEDAMISGNYQIDHAFIPVRDLFSAAQSRIKVTEETPPEAIPKGLSRAPGGMWGTKNKSEQENILARRFFQLIYVIVRYNIPHTFLEFPRLALDPAYTYEKLQPVLNDVAYEKFERIFQLTSRPELINEFTVKKTAQKHSATQNPLKRFSRRIFGSLTRN